MPKPLTPDDLAYWSRPYTYQEFPKMLYRRPRSGIVRSPATETLSPEGTTNTPAGIPLEYLTVQSAADETAAAADGWRDLATTLAGAARHP